MTSLLMLLGLPAQTFATSAHPVSSFSKTAPEEYPVLKKAKRPEHPDLKFRTSPPTASTVPANSCPGTWGRRISGSWPIHPCQSLRHKPVAPILMTTPWGFGVGSGTMLM